MSRTMRLTSPLIGAALRRPFWPRESMLPLRALVPSRRRSSPTLFLPRRTSACSIARCAYLRTRVATCRLLCTCREAPAAAARACSPPPLTVGSRRRLSTFWLCCLISVAPAAPAQWTVSAWRPWLLRRPAWGLIPQSCRPSISSASWPIRSCATLSTCA